MSFKQSGYDPAAGIVEVGQVVSQGYWIGVNKITPDKHGVIGLQLSQGGRCGLDVENIDRRKLIGILQFSLNVCARSGIAFGVKHSDVLRLSLLSYYQQNGD